MKIEIEIWDRWQNVDEKTLGDFLEEFGGHVQIGKENAVTMNVLELTMNRSRRGIRESMHEYRRLGVPIIGTSRGDHKGYYLGRNKAEVDEYKAMIRHRRKEEEEGIVNLP